MSSVIIAASRLNSVAGCPLHLMVKRIAFELSKPRPYVVIPAEFTNAYSHLVIPYLSPPDQPWPDYLWT